MAVAALCDGGQASCGAPPREPWRAVLRGGAGGAARLLAADRCRAHREVPARVRRELATTGHQHAAQRGHEPRRAVLRVHDGAGQPAHQGGALRRQPGELVQRVPARAAPRHPHGRPHHRHPECDEYDLCPPRPSRGQRRHAVALLRAGQGGRDQRAPRVGSPPTPGRERHRRPRGRPEQAAGGRLRDRCGQRAQRHAAQHRTGARAAHAQVLPPLQREALCTPWPGPRLVTRDALTLVRRRAAACGLPFFASITA
mmetsp:Transcript_65760/g.158562  ORF Transcript_65760/g.158562 Transcript_65760/m.158562 type:complete len:256 (+) Transcript_65760:1055-1822(+)